MERTAGRCDLPSVYFNRTSFRFRRRLGERTQERGDFTPRLQRIPDVASVGCVHVPAELAVERRLRIVMRCECSDEGGILPLDRDELSHPMQDVPRVCDLENERSLVVAGRCRRLGAESVETSNVVGLVFHILEEHFQPVAGRRFFRGDCRRIAVHGVGRYEPSRLRSTRRLEIARVNTKALDVQGLVVSVRVSDELLNLVRMLDMLPYQHIVVNAQFDLADGEEPRTIVFLEPIFPHHLWHDVCALARVPKRDHSETPPELDVLQDVDVSRLEFNIKLPEYFLQSLCSDYRRLMAEGVFGT